MSAQGATLGGRGNVLHLPIWPVAALVAAAAAALIGLSLIDGVAPTRSVTPVTDIQRLANSSAAMREQGAAIPVAFGISHVTPKATASAWGSIGGPNEALHRQYTPPQEGSAPVTGGDPIMVNGELCGQCR
jgi:hypothetical protein